MLEKIKELLDVQEIDLKILSLTQEKETLPQELEEFSNALKNKESEKKSLEESLLSTVKNRREKERQLEAHNETLKKFQAQLYQLKNNKEYSALLLEIENIKKEIERTEEEILILMEEIESKEQAIRNIDKELIVKQKELEEAAQRNTEKLSILDARLIEETKERNDRSSGVPQELLRQYERVRHARGGVGVAAIRNGACQGCYMELPPQVVSEAKLGQRLVVCENCNRILYLDESS